MQLPDSIIMIRPAASAGNQAQQAFDRVSGLLQDAGVEVLLYEDHTDTGSVDVVFVNNWLCTLPDGTVAILPMQLPGRREEKRDDILQDLAARFQVRDIEDWSEYEAEGFFLEGTGSMVMDHTHRLMYACLSAKTHVGVLEKFAAAHQYKAMVFHARDRHGKTVNYTNNILSIGNHHAWICEEAFTDDMEQMAVRQLLISTGHQPISFTLDQAHLYAGNMVQLQNTAGEPLLLMSEQAVQSLTGDQQNRLTEHGTIVSLPVAYFEERGQGSIRAMISEIWLPRRY